MFLLLKNKYNITRPTVFYFIVYITVFLIFFNLCFCLNNAFCRMVRNASLDINYAGSLLYRDIKDISKHAGYGGDGVSHIVTNSEYDYVVTFGMAQCVSVVIYNSVAKKGGILHAASLDYLKRNLADFLSEAEKSGSNLEDFQARIIGGFSGEKNSVHMIEYIRNNLGDIKVVGEDILGDTSRSIALDLETGRIFELEE